MTRYFLALGLALVVGCSVLPERAPVKVFEPAPVRTSTGVGGIPVPWSLLVARPIAGQTLDSERIVVRPTPGQIQVYKGAIWSDNAPDLLHTLVLRGFEDSGRILSVTRPGGGVRSQFQLVTELRAFEAVYSQPGHPAAVVELQAKLIDVRDGAVVATRSFQQTQAASGENIDAVVAAFSQALGQLSAELVDWTLASGVAHQAHSEVR